MRSYFSLFLLGVAGVFLVVAPWDTFRFPAAPHDNPLTLWLWTLKCFAVPGCLVLMGMTRSLIVKLCTLVWGLWLTFLSLWIALRVHQLAPEITSYGHAFLGLVTVLSLATVTFASIEFGNRLFKPKPTPKPNAVS